MNYFQRMMCIAVVFAITSVNFINIYSFRRREAVQPEESSQESSEQEDESDTGDRYIDDSNQENDKTLKEQYPAEEPLDVPKNLSYSAEDFQKFSETYLTKSETKRDLEYFDKTLMAGDSLTYHLGMKSLNRVLSENDVVAYPGLTVINYPTYTDKPLYNQSQSKKTSIDWIKKLSPEIIYVMLGTNGISLISTERHINLYSELLESIKQASPKSKIVICSITPYGEAAQEYVSMSISELNKRIDEFNTRLLQLAYESGYYFLNGAEIFRSDNGSMKQEYSSPDGIHWSNNARDEYIDYILTHPVPGY